MTKKSTEKSSVLLRWALRAYPRRFREVHGEDLLTTCRDLVAAKSREHKHWSLFWNLLRHGLGTRLDDVRDGLSQAQVGGQRERPQESSAAAVFRDLRYGVRGLLRAPATSGVAILTLALGVGAVTTIYSVVHSVLLQPLPYANADRLVALGTTFDKPGKPGADLNGASVPNFVDWRERLTTLDELTGAMRTSLVVLGDGEPERVAAAGLFGDFLGVLGTHTPHGRSLSVADQAPGAPRVAVISQRYAERRWGEVTSALGSKLRTNDEELTIVGVLPAAFRGPEGLWLDGVDVWVPRAVSEAAFADRGRRMLIGLGRMAPGTNLEAVRQQADAVAAALVDEYPEDNAFQETRFGIGVKSLHEQTVADSGRRLFVLLGAVGFLLLIACANVAHLVLARANERRREIAVRSALGAGRGRIVSQLMTESLLLAFFGGIAGVALAYAGVAAFTAWNPGDLPRLESVSVDRGVLGFALVVSMATGILFGLAPALRLSQERWRPSLRSAAERHRLRSGLVVVETALALVLLIGAGLLGNSLVELYRVDLGFEPAGVSSLILSAGAGVSPEDRAAFYRDTIASVAAVPGVEEAAASVNLPLGDVFWRTRIENGTEAVSPGVHVHAVSPGYLPLLGLDLAGRDIESGDEEGQPAVAIINESLARELFGSEQLLGQHVLGQYLQLGDEIGEVRIVGLVNDTVQSGLRSGAEPQIFLPYAQQPYIGRMNVVFRSSLELAALAGPVRQAVRQHLDPTMPLGQPVGLEARLERAVLSPRFYTFLVSGFAAVALGLAVVGIFATMLHSVAQQRRELGIRMAVGARRADVVGMVLRQALGMTSLGIVIGLAGAWGLTRFLESFLFNVAATDASTFGMVTVLLSLAAIVAALLPALRAARVDPIRALRLE